MANFHSDIVESFNKCNSSVITAIASDQAVWHNYINYNLNLVRALDQNIYIFGGNSVSILFVIIKNEGRAYIVNIGYIHTGLMNAHNKVIIFGWDQSSIDSDVTLANLNNLIVVRTVRMNDNLVTDL